MPRKTDYIAHRTDMACARSESWRPPLFSKPSGTAIDRLMGAMRRFLDLQAGSVWRDVVTILPHVKGKILDVGCGAQPYRLLVSPEAQYIGIDTDEAKSNFGYEMPDTIYYSGTRWPIEDSAVEFILCTETLEHVLDTHAFLREASRCLGPGGAILLTVPFAARWHFVPHDYWRFTPSSLVYCLDRAGFTDVRVYARGNAVTVACYKVMGLILPLLAAQNTNPVTALAMRLIGLALSPFLVVLAVLANITLLGRGGNDCLGYTVIARKLTAEHPEPRENV
jgi:SAM-dependent methyltransferase